LVEGVAGDVGSDCSGVLLVLTRRGLSVAAEAERRVPITVGATLAWRRDEDLDRDDAVAESVTGPAEALTPLDRRDTGAAISPEAGGVVSVCTEDVAATAFDLAAAAAAAVGVRYLEPHLAADDALISSVSLSIPSAGGSALGGTAGSAAAAAAAAAVESACSVLDGVTSMGTISPNGPAAAA